MENISCTARVVSRVKYKILSGQSVRNAVIESTKSLESYFEKELYRWAQNPTTHLRVKDKITLSQQALMSLLAEGLNGKPIYEPLTQLELEIHESLLSEIQEHVHKLPFLSLIPMLFLIGPALFTILIGPLLFTLILELQA